MVTPLTSSVLLECMDNLRETYQKIQAFYAQNLPFKDCMDSDYIDFEDHIGQTAHALSEIIRAELLDNAFYRPQTNGTEIL